MVRDGVLMAEPSDILHTSWRMRQVRPWLLCLLRLRFAHEILICIYNVGRCHNASRSWQRHLAMAGLALTTFKMVAVTCARQLPAINTLRHTESQNWLACMVCPSQNFGCGQRIGWHHGIILCMVLVPCSPHIGLRYWLWSCVAFACWNLWTAISKNRSNRRMSIGIDRGKKELNMWGANTQKYFGNNGYNSGSWGGYKIIRNSRNMCPCYCTSAEGCWLGTRG